MVYLISILSKTASDYENASTREQSLRSQTRIQRRSSSVLSGGSHSRAPPSYASHPNRRNHQRPSSSPACADRHAGAITYSVPPDVRESFYREQNWFSMTRLVISSLIHPPNGNDRTFTFLCDYILYCCSVPSRRLPQSIFSFFLCFPWFVRYAYLPLYHVTEQKFHHLA